MMANPNSFILSTCLVFFLILLSLKNGCSAQKRREAVEDYYHTVHLSSLISSSSSCKPSAQGPSRKSSLKVVHRLGPCQQHTKEPISKVLEADQSRVNSIHGRRAFNAGTNKFRSSKATLPVISGASISTANYFVNVRLGTPAKNLSLVFDTGSDLTWTQCRPCAGSCYKQLDPIFDPSKSTSYSNISCSSKQCSYLSSATGNNPECSSSTCVYVLQYGDLSFSVGFFSKEKLTLTSTDGFDNFLFGCGQDNRGLFDKTAGILGLGRDPLSFVSQTAKKYGKFFSYCLPTVSGSNGHLTFGKNGIHKGVKYTPLMNTQQEYSYSVDIVAITVGGKQLSISQSIFQRAGTMVDSGTVITRLPRTAYTAMKKGFRDQMKKYPAVPAVSILDTCYDFSNFTTVSIPEIGFIFRGNTKVDLPIEGILIAVGQSTFCLAFSGNDNNKDVGIYGNIQQQTFEVVYDVAGRKLGFGHGGCS